MRRRHLIITLSAAMLFATLAATPDPVNAQSAATTDPVYVKSKIPAEYCPLTILDERMQSPGVSPPPASVSPSRLTVIISDMHLGVGKVNQETWYNIEDFRWADEFGQFLEEINKKGNGKTDLILNGDTFELLESLENDCTYGNKNLGCNESDALKRIEKVITTHRKELVALGKFADAGDNRLILIPGNHDAALYFDKVKEAAHKAIQAKEKDRVSFRVPPESENGYWLSPDQRIYVEHGHQIGKDVNCLTDWPAPFKSEVNVRYLQKPWGEQFVKFLRDYEKEYPVLDNMDSKMDALLSVIAAEKLDFGKGVFEFAKFLLLDVSWEQNIVGALDNQGVSTAWDLKKIRTVLGDQFLVDSMTKDDPFREPMAIALKNNDLTFHLKDLTDAEILMLCDKRAALRKLREDITECPRGEKDLGGLLYGLSSRDARYADHLTKTDKLLYITGKTQRRFQYFIYGHTHVADAGFSPFAQGDWRPRVINSGAWQRVMSHKQLKEIKNENKEFNARELLSILQPEHLPACYNVILIEPYEKEPNVALRYWRQDSKGKWGFSETCNWTPPKLSKSQKDAAQQ